MKIIPIIILSLFLTGCSLFRKHEEPQIPPSKVVQIDKALLEYCPLLKDRPVVNTFNDAVTEYGDLSYQYGVCAAKQAASIKLIKSMGNIND